MYSVKLFTLWPECIRDPVISQYELHLALIEYSGQLTRARALAEKTCLPRNVEKISDMTKIRGSQMSIYRFDFWVL